MNETTNIQLVESLVQTIHSLPAAKQSLLLKRLLSELPCPVTLELAYLAEQGSSLDFWYDELDLYTLEDGEAIEKLLKNYQQQDTASVLAACASTIQLTVDSLEYQQQIRDEWS